MKKSRKEMKMKKRNLREKRKRTLEIKKNELKKLEVKSQSTTKELSYGCGELNEEELPSFVNDFIASHKLNKVIKVPRRKYGMTSSGKPLMCHPNVQKLVDNYGGGRLVGLELFVLTDGENTKLQLFSHSVWITPEGKLADCTLQHPDAKETFREYSMFSMDDHTDFTFFIPMSKKDVLLKDVFVKRNYRTCGYGVALFPAPFKKTRRMNSFVVNRGIATQMGKDWKNGGSFILPSMFTGKYLR